MILTTWQLTSRQIVRHAIPQIRDGNRQNLIMTGNTFQSIVENIEESGIHAWIATPTQVIMVNSHVLNVMEKAKRIMITMALTAIVIIVWLAFNAIQMAQIRRI